MKAFITLALTLALLGGCKQDDEQNAASAADTQADATTAALATPSTEAGPADMGPSAESPAITGDTATDAMQPATLPPGQTGPTSPANPPTADGSQGTPQSGTQGGNEETTAAPTSTTPPSQ